MPESSQQPEPEPDEDESNDPLAVFVLAVCVFMFGISMLVFSALIVVKQGINDVIYAFMLSAFFTSGIMGFYLVHLSVKMNRRLKDERARKVTSVLSPQDMYEAWKKRQDLNEKVPGSK